VPQPHPAPLDEGVTVSDPAPLRVTIAMLTYRRPDDLLAVLPMVLDQAAGVPDDVELLVVDNDPAGGAAATVAPFGARVRYEHEPTPGIAAGRNRALDAAADADLVIFIDDDERPTPGWLGSLLDVYRDSRPAAVVGPVVSEMAVPLEPWVEAGRFFDRRRLPTGSPIDVAATNNLLLDLHVVRDLGLRFDAAFGLSGGSDTLFTRRLASSGARMLWCDEAIVTDVVPADRTTREWVLHRARRSGNSASRCAVALAGGAPQRLVVRTRAVAAGSVRVVTGTARSVLGRVTRSDVHDAKGRRTAARGRGMISGALGSVVFDYARS